MENQRLELYLKKLMHQMAAINQEIFSSGDYREFLSLCNNDISVLACLETIRGILPKKWKICGRAS